MEKNIVILNLTQHKASEIQVASGVVEPSDAEKNVITKHLNFHSLPSADAVRLSAEALADVAANHSDASAVMVGGAPFLMGPLEAACKRKGLKVLYAFSERESIEETLEDGSVVKRSVFNHKGFVEA